MQSINDKVFGQLDFDSGWVREIELTFLGQQPTVELIVEGSYGGNYSILDEQREAYKCLPEAISKAETAIFEFYQSNRDQFCLQLEEEAHTRIPKINNKSELTKVVELTGVIFPMVYDADVVPTGFLLECAWEPEHGLGVKITNEKIEIGTQDILT